MNDSNSFGLFSKEFARCHGLHLVGTTVAWFLLDITYYNGKLLQKDIFSTVGWLPPAWNMNAAHEAYRIAKATALIALCGTVPGYWFTVAIINCLGRFFIQLMGFFFMTVFMFALAFSYHHCTEKAHHIGSSSPDLHRELWAPNAATFAAPAVIFCARLRSTCQGISAVSSNPGAIVGAFGFLYAAQSRDPTKTDTGYPPCIGIKDSLIMLGVISAVGFFFTFLVPESNKEEFGEGDIQVSSARTVPVQL